jgi:ABC-2 type transport system ATP-binding protein
MTVIAVQSLSKTYGDTIAVDDLSFQAAEGRVTGFLGPNGSGKTSTLRVLLGLARPTAGRATFDGLCYGELPDPCRAVGAVLEGDTFHPGRTGRDHLRLLAQQAALSRSRVDEVLVLLDLHWAANRRVGAYSFGMRQRLSLCAALLGDPATLVLDEAANGLDAEGLLWFREFLRTLASEGRTILLSSHVLSEVAQTIDDVVVVRAGRLLAATTLESFTQATEPAILVRTPDVVRLANIARQRGARADLDGDQRLRISGMSEQDLGAVAAEHAVRIYELIKETESLEETYLDLVRSTEPVPA